MTRLPSLRPKQVASALKRAGFKKTHQAGSHLRLKHADGREVVIPMHNKELKRGTLMAIVKQASFTADEFQKLL